MRRVDRWIGAPLCFLLTIFRRLDDLVLRRSPSPAPKRIAVLKLAEQGATVLAYSALLKARSMVGAENLFFVVFAQNRFILDLLDVVPAANVISIRTDGLVRTALETLRAVFRMRREGIDATVDFEFFARSSAILSYLSGARSRSGYHAHFGEASYRGDLMTHRLSFNPFLHAAEMFQVLVEALGRSAGTFPAFDLAPPEDEPLPRFRPEAGEKAEVEAMLREALGTDLLPPVVLLNANCGDLLPLRRWADERYVELAHRLFALAYLDPDEARAVLAASAERLSADEGGSCVGRQVLAGAVADAAAWLGRRVVMRVAATPVPGDMIARAETRAGRSEPRPTRCRGGRRNGRGPGMRSRGGGGPSPGRRLRRGRARG